MFRNIPPVTRNLLLINVVAYLVTLLFQKQINLSDSGSLHFFLAPDFGLWQFVTYMFLHGSFTHLFFNMFALWMFGCVIERVWGGQRFLVFYMVCGIGAGLCQELVQYVQYITTQVTLADGTIDVLSSLNLSDPIAIPNGYGGFNTTSVANFLNKWGTIGASGAIYGILLAFGMLFPDNRIFIFPLPVPIKAKWFVVIYAAIELLMAFTSKGDGVAHVAHLGGMFFGMLLILLWRHHPSSFQAAGEDLFSWGRKKVKARQESTISRERTQPGFGPTRQDDMEYNRRKQERQAEVDAILDKIRMSGYDSLTKEEKQRLFEASKER